MSLTSINVNSIDLWMFAFDETSPSRVMENIVPTFETLFVNIRFIIVLQDNILYYIFSVTSVRSETETRAMLPNAYNT